MERVSTRRARRSEAIRNDTVILDAAITTIANAGWDETGMTAVGRAGDLTYGAVYARYPDKVTLGLALWSERLHERFQRALTECITSVVNRDPVAFAHAWKAAANPDASLVAAVELVLAAYFDPSLQPVWFDASHLLSQALTTAESSPTGAAVNATSMYLMLGLVLASSRTWPHPCDLNSECTRYFAALTSPAHPSTLPGVRADYMYENPFETGDARVDRALLAAVEEIGTVGYHQATITRICRRADVTAGFLYKRYASKLDLFIDATDQLLNSAFEHAPKFVRSVEMSHGAAIAEAVLWREVQSPDLASKRALDLERARLASRESRLEAIQRAQENHLLDELLIDAQVGKHPILTAYMHTEIAMGLGIHAVANLVPSVWSLPFDCITTPLVASRPG